jgi:uncharacterized protein
MSDAWKPLAVVSGASEGIGLAFAEQLAAAGRDVLMLARDEARLALAADRIAGAQGRRPAILALDLTGDDALARLDACLAALGAVPDLLINNAGIGLAGAFAATPAAKIAAVLDLNVVAATRLANYVLPGMLARGRGGVLFVASLAGCVPGPGQATYYASKAYLLSLSEALSAETAGSGVRVTCVVPGPVETGFHAKMGADNAWYRWLVPSAQPATIATRALRAHRLGIRVLPGDVLSGVAMVALRLTPHRLSVALMRGLLADAGGARKT